MSQRLNPIWAEKQKQLMLDSRDGEPYELVESFPKGKTFVVTELAKLGIPFKVYNLGAGVSKITTDTDICPCCKRKL
jgi:hypothetical protein